ncbi:MAG: rhodanese-like domain-containing protein [Balneolaceae bacterium]
MKEITVQELKEKIDNDESFFLLDVREPFEFEISNLNGTLIPLKELPGRVNELEEYREEEVIVMCRSGARSANATNFLLSEGFKNVKNLKGGVNQYAREIDDSLQIY